MIKPPLDTTTHCGNIRTAARVAPERRTEPPAAAPNLSGSSQRGSRHDKSNRSTQITKSEETHEPRATPDPIDPECRLLDSRVASGSTFQQH